MHFNIFCSHLHVLVAINLEIQHVMQYMWLIKYFNAQYLHYSVKKYRQDERFDGRMDLQNSFDEFFSCFIREEDGHTS